MDSKGCDSDKITDGWGSAKKLQSPLPNIKLRVPRSAPGSNFWVGRVRWEIRLRISDKKRGGQIIIVVEAPLCALPVGLRQIQLGSCAPQRTLHHSSSKAQLVEQNSHELSLNGTPRPMTSFDVDQGNGSAQGNSFRIAVGKWGYQRLHVAKHKSAELWSWLRGRLPCPSTTAFCRFEMLWVSFYSSASNFWWVWFQPVGCHTKCTVADNSPQVNQLPWQAQMYPNFCYNGTGKFLIHLAIHNL